MRRREVALDQSHRYVCGWESLGWERTVCAMDVEDTESRGDPRERFVRRRIEVVRIWADHVGWRLC